MTDTTDHPSRRAGLRDELRRAVCEAEGFAWDSDMLEPDEYGDHADTVLAVLYREWPWLRAEAEDASAAVVPAADRAALKTRIAAAVQPLLMDTLPKPIAAVRADEVADAVFAVLPAPADRAAVLTEVADRYQGFLDNADTSADPRYWTGIRDMVIGLRHIAAEAAVPVVGVAADTTPVETQAAATEAHPVCEGFVWIGQSFATCDRCGQPAWDHTGEEVPVEGAGPFDTRRTVRPWKPGQADAIRAKWGPVVEAQPGKDTKTPTVGYSGKGRLWCLTCPRPDREDLPVTIDVVCFGELCAGCGRDVVDVARAAEQPKGA